MPPERAPEGAALAAEGYPLVAGLLEALAAEPADELFLFGLDLLLDGLAARLDEAAGSTRSPSPCGMTAVWRPNSSSS